VEINEMLHSLTKWWGAGVPVSSMGTTLEDLCFCFLENKGKFSSMEKSLK